MPSYVKFGTYQGISAKERLALLTELHLRHANFPTFLIRADLDTQRPAHNLVTKTHADDPDPATGGQC